MSNDETYLEASIDHISTLPNEIRRNLEQIKYLDTASAKVVESLREVEESYVGEVEVKARRVKRLAQQRQLEARKERKKENDSGKVTVEGDSSVSAADATKAAARQTEDGGTASSDVGTAAKSASSNEASEAKKDIDDPQRDRCTSVVAAHSLIPTTEEMRALVEDPVQIAKIAKLRRLVRQYGEEKVDVAEQTYGLLDATIRRLDEDIASFEKERGDFLEESALFLGSGATGRAGGVYAKPNDLAAIQATPNTNEWILAKVISHDPETNMYKLADEDVESNKIFHLPESQVVVLGGGVDKLARGDIVLAVYPDTTSFYQATVVQPAKKVTGGSGSFVMVSFKDDGDENGVTHDKAVPLQHVMRAPSSLTA